MGMKILGLMVIVNGYQHPPANFAIRSCHMTLNFSKHIRNQYKEMKYSKKNSATSFSFQELILPIYFLWFLLVATDSDISPHKMSLSVATNKNQRK